MRALAAGTGDGDMGVFACIAPAQESIEFVVLAQKPLSNFALRFLLELNTCVASRESPPVCSLYYQHLFQTNKGHFEIPKNAYETPHFSISGWLMKNVNDPNGGVKNSALKKHVALPFVTFSNFNLCLFCDKNWIIAQWIFFLHTNKHFEYTMKNSVLWKPTQAYHIDIHKVYTL